MNDVKLTDKRRILHCVVLVCAMMVTTAVAQEKDKLIVSNTLTATVVSVSGRLEVGQTITVAVNGLQEWSVQKDPRKLVPFLNGRALQGLYPDDVNLSGNLLRFHLLRTPESKPVWEDVLREPVLHRPVSFSVGLEDGLPFNTVFNYDHRLTLTVIPKAWGIVSLALVLGGLILLIYLARNTNMLRNPGPSSAADNSGPYDLGRVQMAFWFFLILSSYVCLWLVTGDLDTITGPLLSLMGISSATALGAHLMGPSASSTGGSVSAGFLTDILSDSNGYCFHNFQIFAWTLMLGIIFVCSVYDNLAMPKFSSTLLALTGISAGTYLGFQFVGQQNRTKTSFSMES